MTQLILGYPQVNILLSVILCLFFSLKKKKNLRSLNILCIWGPIPFIWRLSFSSLESHYEVSKLIIILPSHFLKSWKTCPINILCISWVPIKTESLLNVDRKTKLKIILLLGIQSPYIQNQDLHETIISSMLDTSNERNSKSGILMKATWIPLYY